MGTVHAKEFPVNMNDTVSSDSKFMDKNDTLIPHGNQNEKSQKEMKVNFDNIKVRVDKIHIDGLGRTKDDIIKYQVSELFKAENFMEVIIKAHKVRSKLDSLGCFKNISVNVDTSKGPDATPDGVEVTFKVEELKRVIAGFSTMIGDNEASLLLAAKAPNILGRGEKVGFEYSYGNNKTSNVNVSFIKPFFTSKLNKSISANIYDQTKEYPWSGYKQNDKGILVDLAFDSNELGTFKHNLQYEAVIRDLSPFKQASFKIREQCGPTLKSAVRHICTVDKRNESIFPTSGTLVQCTTEIAGLGGNIGFLKNELVLQTNWSPSEFLTFQLVAQGGFLRGISNDMHTNIADSFFLGGPLNLRGFQIRGCGPRDNGDSLGGNTYWASGLHVYTPLPLRPAKSAAEELFRLHGFVNAGNVCDLQVSAKTYEENLKSLFEQPRLTVGCGIAMRIGQIARAELNFCVPLRFLRTDIQQRVQLGIGVQYL